MKTQDNNDIHDDDEYEDDAQGDPVVRDDEEDIKIHAPQGPERAIASVWRENFGQTPNPATIQAVKRWSMFCRCGEDLVREAIGAAAARNANDPVGYVISLFKDWNRRGIRSAEDLD